jgi:ribonuclease HI
MIVLHFDGLYRGIPGGLRSARHAGVMCYGWLISRDGVVIARGHGGYARGRDATSNIAEYLAMIEGLEALRDLGLEREPVEVIGDARSIIQQMEGVAAVNSPRVRPLYARAVRLARHFHQLIWVWRPRRDNHQADQLTRRALRQIRADAAGYQRTLAVLEGTERMQDQKRFHSLLDLRIYQPLNAG